MVLFCPYCSRKCKNRSGLTQHINLVAFCRFSRNRFLGVGPQEPETLVDDSNSRLRQEDGSDDGLGKENSTERKRRRFTNKDIIGDWLNSLEKGTIQQVPKGIVQQAQKSMFREGFTCAGTISTHASLHNSEQDTNIYDSDQENFATLPEETYQPESDSDSIGVILDVITDYNNDRVVNASPNTTMRASFREYCHRTSQMFQDTFNKVESRGIRLLSLMQRIRAPLDSYAEIMEWHHIECGHILQGESLANVKKVPGDGYLSRTKLLDSLKTRYHMEGKFPTTERVRLPSSNVTVNLTRHNAWGCIESLLTDPRITDKDYNFFNNNPLSPPPQVSEISDLNTGKAYYDAYQKYITKPDKQVLLPIVMYIDGAVTGQFMNLPITALKLSLGIFGRKTRDKEYAWRTLGYVAEVPRQSARGSQIFHSTAHIDATTPHVYGAPVTPDDDFRDDSGHKDVHKSQDLHTMLDCLLESYREVQQNGFIWDLRYGGKTYVDLEFVPFVMFIKCDTDEGDQLCGSYKSRGNGVSQLCRRCTCPTGETDLVRADFPPKTTEMISSLVDSGDEAALSALRGLSQQNLVNAWYKIRFHPATNQGVHGACPSEMLHAILLGIFKYTRDCFFEQLGKTSELSDEIDSLAQSIGESFSRQSERDMPKCKFQQGIKRGKLMAKEFRGIMLVMATILRCKKGRDYLSNEPNFDVVRHKDWVLLVETLLQWEAFLNEETMSLFHVLRLRRKNMYIMYLMKKVANRKQGMGLKLTKFHMVSHLWHDVLLYGVPLEVDTGSNESHHKKTKVAARLTQKNEKTLDLQTCHRLDEFLLTEMAMEEKDGEKLWNYFSRPADLCNELQIDDGNFTCGAHICVTTRKVTNPLRVIPLYWHGREGERKEWIDATLWNRDLVTFLTNLQGIVGEERMLIRSEHRRGGIIFRGHPSYRGQQWRDWALFNWGDSQLPGHIWCFVILSFLSSEQKEILHGGIMLNDGTYAVVESASPDTSCEENRHSEIFLPYLKQVKHKQSEKRAWKRKFFLADVDSIVKPLVVIPNIGGKSGTEFLLVKSRSEWVDDFKTWLEEDHSLDDIGEDEPIPSHGVD